MSLVAILVTACIPVPFQPPSIGDPGFYVEYRNLTGKTVTLHIIGERDGPPDVAPLAPDATSGSLWRYPRDDGDQRRVVVFATDASDTMVFCATFDRQGIRAVSHRIEVIAGKNSCR
jgi:hypothetical protein